MNASLVKRAPDGKLLPGSILNPGGRPRSEIERVRELLGQHRDEIVGTLMQLIRSDDEAIRLAAVKEAFDRMLGKAPIAADVTTTKFDLGAAYLAALKLANLPPAEAAIDVTPAPDVPAGVECNSTTEW
jgi:hypothetical protein